MGDLKPPVNVELPQIGIPSPVAESAPAPAHPGKGTESPARPGERRTAPAYG
jgi:hypothetical protein